MSAFTAGNVRGNAGLVARLLEHVRRPFTTPWSSFGLRDTDLECVGSYHGDVVIQQTHAGLSVQTCVKGEPDRAVATAVQRIADYHARNNSTGTRHHAVGPLVRREEAPGRWLVSAGLRGAEDAFVAAMPRNGKVRIRPVQPEVIAVLRMSGRPTAKAVARGYTAIQAALSDTLWTQAGEPVVRFYRAPAILPFTDRFEVALPIARQHHYAPLAQDASSDTIPDRARMERATRAGLPVHVLAG